MNTRTLAAACRSLADAEPLFRLVHGKYGMPPLWDRPEGFRTLLQIILEQQVSLASARACFEKLCLRTGIPTPATVLSSTDAELKADGFSRQKTSYARYLAEAVLEKRIDFDNLAKLPDAEVKAELGKLKGVGVWTADIYLLMALLRPDVMPKGDVALHTAWHKLSGEPRPTSDEFVQMAEKWKPHRSAAARLLWHYYLSTRAETRAVASVPRRRLRAARE